MKRYGFLLFAVCSAANGQIIFETDFREDVGYFATNQGITDTNNVPSGWDGVRVTGQGRIEVNVFSEVAPYPTLKLAWDPNLSQPEVILFKHLTGDINTGFDELFIRYHVRFPDNFKVGNGQYMPYWKWGRLWQNTHPEPRAGVGAWSELRDDAYYVVWNFGGEPPYTDINAAWGANIGDKLEKASSDGEHILIDYFVSGSNPPEQPGYFESMGGGDWEFVKPEEDLRNAGYFKNRDQRWHTIEYHFKLATTPTANDGVFEVWFDGVKQIGGGLGGQQGWTRALPRFGAPALNGIPTARNGGSGFNMFSFFDNMTGWNSEWADPSVDGFIYVKDVVISDSRIGHEYSVGSPLPLAPEGFLVH
jgi:hypothetical protein